MANLCNVLKPRNSADKFLKNANISKLTQKNNQFIQK